MAICKYYKPYMDILKNIVGKYYKLDGCGAGGPLHVLLDDGNYGLHTVHFCMDTCFEALADPKNDRLGYSKEVYLLGIMICNEYAKMSLEERAVFDSYSCGNELECCGKCDECRFLDEHYEWIKEKEQRVNL